MAKRVAAKRTSAPASIAMPVLEEPVGHWAQVLAEAQETPGVAIEPFVVTKDLVLQPLSPRRSRKLSAAQNAYFSALGATANAAKFGATKEQAEEIQKWIDESLTAYNEALFGETDFLRVVEYFENQDGWKQEVFTNAVKRHFLRLPDDDGNCPTCGVNPERVDEQITKLRAALAQLDPKHPLLAGADGPAVGKEDGSSTTSSTTGSSSSETSQQNSAESTHGTGSEDRDPGPSSSSTQTA